MRRCILKYLLYRAVRVSEYDFVCDECQCGFRSCWCRSFWLPSPAPGLLLTWIARATRMQVIFFSQHIQHCTSIRGAILGICELFDIWAQWWEDMTWLWKAIAKTILEICDIWDTDYNSDSWEPEFMTIIVAWQLRVTVDSIRSSCNVFNEYYVFT